MRFEFKTLDMPPHEIVQQLKFAARAMELVHIEGKRSHSSGEPGKKPDVQWEYTP